MGSLYFIVKNFILTVLIVCLLQIKWGGKTLETHFMGYIRTTLAPKFFSTEGEVYITREHLKLNYSDLAQVKEKLQTHPQLKGLTQKTKDLVYDVLKKTFSDPGEDNDTQEKEN